MAIDFEADPELRQIADRLYENAKQHGCTCTEPKFLAREEITDAVSEEPPEMRELCRRALAQRFPFVVEVFLDHHPGCYLYRLRWAPYN